MPYHMIDPQAEESTMVVGLDKIEGLEGQPKVKVYLYLDDMLLYKTKTLPPSDNLIINTEITM